MNDKNNFKNVCNQFPIRGSLNFISVFFKAAIEAAAIYVIIGYIVDDRINLIHKQTNYSLLDSAVSTGVDPDVAEKSKPKSEVPVKEEKAIDNKSVPTPTPVKEKVLTFKETL